MITNIKKLLWNLFIFFIAFLVLLFYRSDFIHNKRPFYPEDYIDDPDYRPKAGDVILTRCNPLVSLFSWFTHVANVYKDHLSGRMMVFNLTFNGFEIKPWERFVKEYNGVIFIRPILKNLNKAEKRLLSENVLNYRNKKFDKNIFMSYITKKFFGTRDKISSTCTEGVNRMLEPLNLVLQTSTDAQLPYDYSSRGKALDPKYYGKEILIKSNR